MIKWFFEQVASAVVSWGVGILLAAVLIVFGVVPEQVIAKAVGKPPDWLFGPWSRIAFVAITALLVVALLWRRWPSPEPVTTIPLIEVAAMAYQRNKDTGFGLVWEEHQHRDGVLLYYAGHIAKEGLAVGSKPPSQHLQPVHLGERQQVVWHDEQLVVAEVPDGTIRWKNLQVRSSDKVAALKEMDRLLQQPDWFGRS